VAEETSFRPDDGRTLPCAPGRARSEFVERGSGLRLTVTAAGARAWSVAYYSSHAGFTRRLRLGDASRMSLASARAAARKALHAAQDEGRDPHVERLAERERVREERRRRAEERRVAAERRRRRLTVGELVESYIRHRRRVPSGKYGRVVRAQTVALWRGMLRNHVRPVLGERLVESVRLEDVLDLLEAAVARGGPTMGPRVRDFFGAAWRWAQQRTKQLGVEVPPLPLAAMPRVGRVEAERDRALTPAELWRFWRATEGDDPRGAALRFSLLTATRVREALLLPWSELDLETRLWTLPAERCKTARRREIPLSPQAVELLERRRDAADAPRVFGRSTRVDDLMARVRAAVCGEPPLEARDLRRAAAVFLARIGVDPFVVSLVLGHAKADERVPAVTRVYLRDTYAAKQREALDRLGAWVEETVSSEGEPGAVVGIEARR
jgi:hypothetical protein